MLNSPVLTKVSEHHGCAEMLQAGDSRSKSLVTWSHPSVCHSQRALNGFFLQGAQRSRARMKGVGEEETGLQHLAEGLA